MDSLKTAHTEMNDNVEKYIQKLKDVSSNPTMMDLYVCGSRCSLVNIIIQ